MKRGLRIVPIAVLLACSRAGAAGAGTKDEGWVPLFNGRNLEGWRRINGRATYEVEDGMIVGTTAKGSPNSFLCTERLYEDFVLVFEVKLDPRLNSGVQIRSNSLPSYRNGRVHGYQVEIATGGDAGFIYDEARRGWLSKDRSDPRARAAFKRDDWNRYRVVCVGDIIRTWLDGVPVAHVIDAMTPRGFIGLQVHAFGGDPPAKVRWRNLRIRVVTDRISPVIDRVEKACIDRTVYMIGREKAERLAALVHRAKPLRVVECGTAIGYSGLWIARELAAAGAGHLTTIELRPERAREAEAHFREAGLADFVTVRVGDARKVVREIEGPIDFAFIDCGYANYLPCLKGLEEKLRDGAVVVADNVGIGAGGMADYLKHVRAKYESRTEWFDVDLPWCKRDAMEITVIAR